MGVHHNYKLIYKKKAPAIASWGEKKLGGDLLFRTLAYSTIGDEGLDF